MDKMNNGDINFELSVFEVSFSSKAFALLQEM